MTIDAAEAAEIAELERQQAAAGQGPGGQGNGAAQEQKPAEAVSQEQPEAEQQAEPDDTEEIEVENRGRFVRASSLKAENERRRDAERRAAEVEAKYAADMSRVTERLAMLVENGQRPSQQAEQQVQIPDINQDPLGHFQAQFAQANKRNEELSKRIETFEQRTTQTDAMQKVGEEVTRLETEFSRTNTDYSEAMAHLRSTWEAEAQVAGVPPQVAIRARALEIAQLAARSNRNPAELGYQLAKARGYVKRTTNGAGNGQTGPNLETLAKGIASSKSAGSAPGRAAPGTPTLEALLNMEDEEFAKKYVGRDNRNWERDLRRLAN